MSEKQYMGENATLYLIQLLKTALNQRIKYNDIVNNLESDDSDKPLSAVQGKKLLEQLSKLNSLLDEKIDTKITKNDLITYLLSQKGVAGGLTPLGDDRKINSEYLPSYVDDVIEGYLEDGVFYEDEHHSQSIRGERGKIYIDLNGSGSYRWTSGGYVQIVSSDMVEMTGQDIQLLWDEILD